MMNASKQASPFLPSFFPEGQFSEPFNPNLDIEAKPSLVDETGLRLVEEPPNSERKGVPKPNSPEPDFGWHLITDGIYDLSPSSPVESSPILSPSDTDDSDSEWKWRKRYGDEIDCQKLLVKWEAEMFRRKTRMWPELYFHNAIFESEGGGKLVEEDMNGSVEEDMNGSVEEDMNGLVEEDMNGSVEEDMNGSVEEDMNGLVEEDMNGSVEE
ncbi:hypothetical protein OROHE_005424 [Orobanche hederae]